MTGYEALAQASSPSGMHFTLTIPKDGLVNSLPSLGGALLGALAWPAHRVLGALDGAAIVHSITGLIRGTMTKKEAVRNLGSHALATMGALTLRIAPAAGYIMGALAGGLAARVLDADDGKFTVFIGGDAPNVTVVYADHDTVLTVQSALKSKGFDPGPLDGQMGPKTSAAIQKMQGAIGAEQTGVIDYGVLSALQVTPSKQARALQKNLASNLPEEGRPAKGWSQPGVELTKTIEKRPAWQTAALIAGVVVGIIVLSTGIYFLVVA